MNICKIQYISVTLFISLSILLVSCTGNIPTAAQLVNPPASTDNKSATKGAPQISTGSKSAIKAAPAEINIQSSNQSQKTSGFSTLSAMDSDNVRSFYGKEVIVEGAVVELGTFNDQVHGNPMVLYFSNPYEHVKSYDDWARGMTGADFRVIIDNNNVSKFCYPSMFLGRTVAIKGKIDYYHDAPVIFVTDPSQVTFVGTPLEGEPSLLFSITCTTEVADNITCYRYQGTITNNNTEWAVGDLYFGENKIADCIAPKGCPTYAADSFSSGPFPKKEVTMIRCNNFIKLDLKIIANNITGADEAPSMKQISIPPLHYKWLFVPKQQQ